MPTFKNTITPHRLRDALKKLGKNDEQVPVPVTGAFHLISSKLRAATCLVDVSGVGLDYVKLEGRKLAIGGTATFQQIVTSKELNEALNGLLPKAARAYSTKIQRNATTLQDVLFGYATYFDLLTALLALDTQVTVQGKQKRVVPLQQFFVKDNRAVLGNSGNRRRVFRETAEWRCWRIVATCGVDRWGCRGDFECRSRS